MGLLINGTWHDQWYDTKTHEGEFVRNESQFRHWITTDGSSDFPAEADRYHLYVSLACPWAHRTLVMRALKGLQNIITVDIVHPLMLENGWSFKKDSVANADSQLSANYLYQIYTHEDPDYSGRVTVPVLWDKKQQRIVNNESADIIRMLNSAFDNLGATKGDYYPLALHSQIDELNSWIYDTVNNGVYKAGFATTQAAYDGAVSALFKSLDNLNERLSTQRYLLGDQMSEADIRLFTTLIRFDPVYVSHFKCDLKRIADYPALSGYLRDIYQTAGIAETVEFDHIKQHYYCSHTMINPTGIIPVGPAYYLNAPHGRASL
ncbi:glutathione S-transferase family protein [Neptunomonas qingdaonensis]|uniref:Putative glutathione S-transferase n=1 Tax=Neptunomonas qingdaonensis TaxID=1045558 RepID=A0A1I2T2Z3_9GAMM|nr:glutathione S-transferase family protein [Neptunomonas qingdaonensis]SFG59373.1 putative glutathione S-transferase [Neptunomonas qingdaonensis]